MYKYINILVQKSSQPNVRPVKSPISQFNP